jgi:DNA-binding response OmpR family regulator
MAGKAENRMLCQRNRSNGKVKERKPERVGDSGERDALTMSHILVIDDEEDLVRLLRDSLVRGGHRVTVAGDGEEGVRLALNPHLEPPDLILLDIMMPGMDGYAVCRRIRDAVACPILFLSAKQAEMDKIRGLALGGDDYIVKPFSLKELLARIEAHLRRERRAGALDRSGGEGLVRAGGLTLDLKARQVAVRGQPVGLTRKEFDILELLALHAGQVFAKEQIYEKVWGYEAEGDSATVAEHVKNIRAKLAQADPRTEYIETVWGIGYRLRKFR